MVIKPDSFINIKHPLGNSLGRKFDFWLLDLLIRSLSHTTIEGLHHVPMTGPLVVVINHIAYLDPVAAVGLFPRYIMPISKREAFDHFLPGLLMRWYGVIPINRGGNDITAIKLALNFLKNGGAILLAPEGTRSRNYQLQEGKEGAVMMALRSKAPILPIGVTGTETVKSYWQSFKRAPVHLSVGPPFYLRPSTPKKVPRSEMMAITHEVMYRIAAQLPPEYRGLYSDLNQATTRYIEPFSKFEKQF